MLEDKDKQKKIRERRLEYIYLFLLMIVFNFITGFFLMKYDFLLTIIHSISVYFLIKVKCLSYDNEELSFKNIFFIKTVNLLNYLLVIILLNIFSKYISFIPIPHFLYLIEILVSSIVVMRLIFVAYIIIDKDLNFIDSIKLSYLLTQKNFIRIFIEIIRFFLVVIIYSLLSELLKSIIIKEASLKELISYSYGGHSLKNITWEIVDSTVIIIIITYYLFKLYKKILKEFRPILSKEKI